MYRSGEKSRAKSQRKKLHKKPKQLPFPTPTTLLAALFHLLHQHQIPRHNVHTKEIMTDLKEVNSVQRGAIFCVSMGRTRRKKRRGSDSLHVLTRSLGGQRGGHSTRGQKPTTTAPANNHIQAATWGQKTTAAPDHGSSSSPSSSSWAAIASSKKNAADTWGQSQDTTDNNSGWDAPTTASVSNTNAGGWGSSTEPEVEPDKTATTTTTTTNDSSAPKTWASLLK